jgi:hypothetical protein
LIADVAAALMEHGGLILRGGFHPGEAQTRFHMAAFARSVGRNRVAPD